MRADKYIDDLVANGRHHFTTKDAILAIGKGANAVRSQLRRLKRLGRIATPIRSFHVVVAPEYRRLGCLPAIHFIDQLMNEIDEAYYITLLSAAEIYGAAHQRPQSLYVMVNKNRPDVACGQVRIVFIARNTVSQIPIKKINTPRGYARCATPEVTALELVGYPHQAGGLNNVATVLVDLAEKLDAGKLLEAATLSPVGWSQRLGYLLELVAETEIAKPLASYVQAHANTYTPLRRLQPVAGAKRCSRWKLIINEDVEPDE